MNYPIRKELVGKRFMCVRDRTTQNSRPNSRSNRFSNPLDYTWKCGIIRACSKEDSNDIEQKVLVEYDNQDWSSREWISIYKETWKIFLVEERMVWAQREDPNNPKRPILWPALTFYSLVDKHGLDESNSIGVEFLGDHMRTFCTSNEMRQYQEDDGLQPALRNNSKVVNELMNWQTLQKSQGILIHGPFTLTGFRVQVYREKCRQWFSAVITSHDLITREMDVMDDTVLQTHRINPRLVMVLLLANEVELDSMLRGDLVRVLPSRRNRQSVVITSPSPETNNSGNSMWQFLNDMWNEPHACHSGQDSSARYSSSLTVNKAPATTQEGTTAKSATQKRRKSNTSRQSKRKSSEYTESPQPNQPTSNLRLLSPYQNQENTSTHQNHMSSPVQSSLGHSSSSGHHLSSPISSPVHHRSHYSSMEDLLRTSSSPSRQHISPQRPSSASLIHPSPQRPYSSPQKTPPHVRLSPGDQQTATSKMVDPKHGLLGSPSHSNMRQYTPPHSSASLSPFRASEVFATPVVSAYDGLVESAVRECGTTHHCHDTAAHLIGGCSCNTNQSISQSILTNQLYALQLQQQHQLHQQQQQQIKQHQNLSHCQMYISQLQLLAERLKSVQQGALTPDQREMLNLLYKHILLQYQEASMSDYHSPAVAAARLQMQMQLKYLEDQEKQLKYMRQPYLPSFEPEHLKSFLSPNAVGSNTEHLQNLCASFSLQQHNQEFQEVTKNFDQNKPTVKEHVARLKRFMPILQHQDNNDAATPASSSVTFPSSLKSSSGELPKKSSCYAASPSNNPSTISHICSKEEDNKTDDQKVVAALVNSKSSVPEKDVLISQSQDLSSNILATSRSVTSPKSETSQKSKDINCLHSKKEQNDDPFGFDQIGDDSSPNSKQSTGTNSKQSTGTNSKPTTGTNSKPTTVTKSKPTIGTISKPTTDTNSKPTTDTNSKPTTGMDLSSDLSQNMKDDIVNQIVPMKTDIGVDSPNQSLEKDDVTLEQKQNENLVSSILEPVQTNSIISSSVVVQDSFTKDNKNLQPQAITPCPINKNTFKEKTKSKLSTKNQKQLSSVVSPCMTSTSNSDNKKTNATCTLNTLQSIESIEEDKKPATQQANFIINKTENDVTSNRASVIKYIDRKCGSKVKTSFDSLGDSKEKSVTSPTGSLPFSVSQLLEFHKTSAQAAVKVFEEQNNSALDVHGNPQLSQEKAKGMKRKRKKQDKVFPECEGKTPEKSSSQRTLQLPGAQKLFSGPHQDNSPDSKTTISSSQDLVSRFLGHEGKSKFFPELNIVATSQSLSQEALQSKKAINIPKIEKTTSEQNKSRAVEEQKCHDWRMTRENRSLTLNSEKPSQKEVSKSSVPVNFVADQTVRSLTTVNRAQEPVALSSLIGTEQNVEQIRREDSEDDMSKALSEQRRQRKKSRKVLENESMDESNEKRKPKSNSEPRKRKKAKLVDKDNSKNMDGSDNGETKPDVVKVTKKRVRKKDKEESLDKESSLLVDPKDKVQREIFSSEQTSQEADCKSIKGELQADSEVKVVSEKVKPEDEQKENNEKTHCNQESKIDLQSQENESFKPVLQRSWSEDTIELNLECGERMNDVTNENDSVDLSATKYSLPEDTNNAVPDEKGKSIVFHGVSTIKDECITEEKPLKEIIDKLAAKKKIGNKKPHKRKRTQENSEGQEIKKRKVKEPAEEFFIQSDNCAMFPKLPRCRDCRDREDDTGLSPTQNCCRFALFRRLKKKRRSGKIHVAGFMMPENAEQEDLTPWIASDDVSSMLSKDGAHYILSNIADEFCSLVQEEKGAKNSRGDGAVISYKRAVGGFREMCDACATTIFNIHWVCHRCGFGVCLDCYNLRVQEKINTPQFGRKMFQFKWFHCIPGLSHQPKNLTIAQIIPKEVLNDLSDKLHQIRSRWNIGKDCPCQYKQLNRGEDPEESKPELADGLNHVCKMLPTSPKAELKSDPENQETKKTLMEKVRERIKERMGANKIEENGTNPSSNFDETKHEKEHKKPSDESEQITQGSGKVSQTTLDEHKITDEQKCSGASQTVTLIGASSESPKGILPTGDKDLIKEEKRSSEELVNNTLEGLSGFSSGLTLLQNYDSSSEDSPENSPQTCLEQPGPTNSAFDFNLGLLALVASKRTETEDHHFGQQLDNKEDVLPAVDKGVEEQKLMNWFKKETSEQISIKTENDVSSNNAVTATKGEASCSSITSDNMGTRDHPQPSLSVEEYPAPHSFMCNRRLLRLHEPHHPGNQDAFAKRWIEGKPILVSNIDKLLDRDLWSPESFEKEFGEEIADVVNCRTGKTVENFRVGDFWKGFECVKERALDSSGEPMLLKLKDWPPGDDFCEKLPSRFQNLMDNIPLPAYTRRDGLRNLASRLPSFFVKPDLGPKMYNAYGSAAHPNEGTTNLHIDMSDAVNIMVYVGVPRDEGAGEKERAAAIKAVDIACDEIQQQRVRRETARIGALWHIFEVDDADKIREFLLEVGKERKLKYSTHHDPIHDQCFYLDEELLERLKRDHNVEGYAICQCLGDGVFIPAGAPHQVRNLYSCVKIAEDFVSPERIGQCFKTTQEFRHLSDKHTNHEDKLQIKNIIYHAVKDAVSVLEHHEKLLQEQNNTIIDS